MSDSVKSPSASHPVAGRGNLYRAAIVGAASLRGKEVAEMLNERNFPAADIRLLDDDESLGQLEAMGDEISFIQRVRAEQFEHVDFTFFASDEECTRANWKDAQDAGSAIIDLSSALENEPGASVRSLWIERERGQIPPPELQPGPCVTAHPAAVTLALLLLRARKAGAIRRATATIFEPASERGQRGMDELHQQTVNLLSFQPLPKDVYDAQVAFNMLARHGLKSKPALDSTEARISRHYRKIAGDDAPQPALLLLQAPTLTVTPWPFLWKWRTPSMSRPCRKPSRATMSRFRARTRILPATSVPPGRPTFNSCSSSIPRSPMESGYGPPPTISASPPSPPWIAPRV